MKSTNIVVQNAMNKVAKNSQSQSAAAEANKSFLEAFRCISACVNTLDLLRDYGKPNGFTDEDAKSAKMWADKVYSKVVGIQGMMKQGRINSL